MRRVESASQVVCGGSVRQTCLPLNLRRPLRLNRFRLNNVVMLKKRLSDIWSLPAVFFCLLLLVLPVAAQNIAIHLKNGDRITGRILSESTNAVTVTNFLGTIQIPLNEIARREVLPTPPPPATTNIAAAVSSAGTTNVAT